MAFLQRPLAASHEHTHQRVDPHAYVHTHICQDPDLTVKANGTPAETIGPTGTASPTVESSATMTPTPKGENFTDFETAGAATGTALAEFEAAVIATTTALATPGQESGAGGEGASTLLDLLCRWAGVLLLGGLGLGAILIAIWMGIAIIRGPSPSRK